MFTSSEWTKKENLCVDTIIFLDSRGKNARFFSTFFFLSVFARVNQTLVKIFQGKDPRTQADARIQLLEGSKHHSGGCDLQELHPTINHPGSKGCHRPTLGVGPEQGKNILECGRQAQTHVIAPYSKGTQPRISLCIRVTTTQGHPDCPWSRPSLWKASFNLKPASRLWPSANSSTPWALLGFCPWVFPLILL